MWAWRQRLQFLLAGIYINLRGCGPLQQGNSLLYASIIFLEEQELGCAPSIHSHNLFVRFSFGFVRKLTLLKTVLPHHCSVVGCQAMWHCSLLGMRTYPSNRRLLKPGRMAGKFASTSALPWTYTEGKRMPCKPEQRERDNSWEESLLKAPMV